MSYELVVSPTGGLEGLFVYIFLGKKTRGGRGEIVFLHVKDVGVLFDHHLRVAMKSDVEVVQKLLKLFW